jgi:ComF family protein
MLFLRETVRLFFPRICPACHHTLLDSEGLICITCTLRLPRTGYAWQKDNFAARMLMGRIPLNHTGSYLYFRNGGISRALLHAIKYRGRQDLAFFLGRMFAAELQRNGQESHIPEVLVPVPLHPDKRKQRGYNQAEQIAKGMAAVWNIPVETSWLLRTENRVSQTRGSRLYRWKNTQTLYTADVPNTHKNTSKAVIDDVLTTGATLEACTRALLQTGCTQISAFTLAVTEQGK